MTEKRNKSDSSGFEDLAEELEAWDETFDSLHAPELEAAASVVSPPPAADAETPPAEKAPPQREYETYPALEDVPSTTFTPTPEGELGAELEMTRVSTHDLPHAPPPSSDIFDEDEVEISIVAEEAPPPPIVSDEPLGIDVAIEPTDPFGDVSLGADLDPFADAGPFEPVALGSLFEKMSDVPPRRGPAIVRRDELERRRLVEATGDESDDAADEWDKPSITNVMAQETVDRMVETAAAFFADDEPESDEEFEIELDGDFYDDIEIDESDESSSITGAVATPVARASTETGAVRRTMAHVVRRAPASTAPPSSLQAAETAVSIDVASLDVGERIAPDAALEAAHRAIDELTFDEDSGLLPIERRPLEELGSAELDAGGLLISSEPIESLATPVVVGEPIGVDPPAPKTAQPSPLSSLNFDLPPQLPTPRLAFTGDRGLAELTLELPDLGEPLPESAGQSKADIEAAIDLLLPGPDRASFHRGAASIALGRDEVEAARRHLDQAKSDSPSPADAFLERRLAARSGGWQELADNYSAEGEAGAVLAGELAVALGQTATVDPDSGDAGSLLRAATAEARAGDVAKLAVHARALASLVADDGLRRALDGLAWRAGNGEGGDTSAISGDIVSWEIAARGEPTDRAATALVLADAIEARGDDKLADGFRIVAAGLCIHAGDAEGARVALSRAADNNAAHPAVCRPLLTLLQSADDDVADYLVAVASGSPAAPLAARALWRWSEGVGATAAEEMLRRAHALAPEDALILSSLESARAASGDDATEDAVAEVGLALAPVLGGGLVESLNRARAAHLAGNAEGREKALAGVELPTERLLVVAERLAHIGRGAELGAAPTGVSHEVLWRHRTLSNFGRPHPTAVAAELTAAAADGDRLSARARLASATPLETAASEELWDAAAGWSDLGGKVELAQARLGEALEIDDTSARLSMDGATIAFDMVGEWDDPRLRWLAATAAARSGDWQRAADRMLDLTEGRYRAAFALLEKAADPTGAEALLVELLEEHPEREYLAELTTSARRQLGVLAPEATTMPAAAASSVSEPFSGAIRAAEAHDARGDFGAAAASYRRALELHPGDPIAIRGLEWTCARAKDAAPIAELTLAELRRAEEAGDAGARADAYETLARIDDEIANDPESAAISWESAADCDPSRREPLRALELAFLTSSRHRELLIVFGRLLALTESDRDRAVLLGERARVSDLCGRDPADVALDYAALIELEPMARMPLFFVEDRARLSEPSREHAALADRVAVVLGSDPRSAAAFLCRAGEALAELGDHEGAIAKYREATNSAPGHLPALDSWREAAMRGELWIEFSTACELAAEIEASDERRAELLHLAGVSLMDRALDGARATAVLERSLASGFEGDDAFARLRVLFDETGDDERLGDLLRARLETEEEPATRLALHLELAALCRNFWNDRVGAASHLRSALEIEPYDHSAVADLSDISWELGAWDIAAESLLTRAKLETSPNVLKHIFYRLGTIYADHLPDPSWAIRSFRTVLSHDPNDAQALERLAVLNQGTGDFAAALSALERLLKLDIPPSEKVTHLHRVAEIQRERGQLGAAERAVRVAFDLAPGSHAALGVLLGFYGETGDVRSIRVNLDRAAQAMRSRYAANIEDPEPLGVIARVLAVRERAGVPGSLQVARVTAELARFLGDEADELVEIVDSSESTRLKLEALARPEPDDLLTPAVIPAALRHILRALRTRVGKYVGADPKRFGVGRGDRQKRGKHPVANLAAEMAAELGLRGTDIYVSSAALGAAIAIPTDPVAIVLGSRFASLDRAAELTFALGRGLKLGQMGMALVDTMTPEDLDLFVGGVIRQFAPDYVGLGLSAEALAGEQHRIRRLVPGSLANELAAHAMALVGLEIEPGSLHAAMRQLGLRAGLVASTNAASALAAALRLGGHSSIQEAGEDPDILDFVRFALSEEHVLLQALLREEQSNSG